MFLYRDIEILTEQLSKKSKKPEINSDFFF